MALTRTTDASVEPVTLKEAKDHLRVDWATEDDAINRLIATARRQIEEWEWRAHITQTWTAEADDFDGITDTDGTIWLPRPNLISAASIKYWNTSNTQITLVENTDYEVDTSSRPGRIALVDGQSWPTVDERVNAVEIVYTAGYGSAASNVPEETKTAILLLVEHLHKRREGEVDGISTLLRPIRDQRTLRFL